MRKISALLAVLMLCMASALAQSRLVTGQVSDEQGVPIPFATVVIKGTQRGTTTDLNGVFKINVANNDVLVISAVGVKSSEYTIGSTNTFSIKMERVGALDEVVVTALGIRREKKALGYAVQEVKGENLTFSNSVDISGALAGKVAGVKLYGSPSSSFDNASVIIRGASGLGLVQPLFVLDGTPVDQNAVNMDNIESVSVLKGPAATALYGQRAGNGVIILTSKKGRRGGGTTVEVKTGIAFENLSLIPEYQNEYAGGYSSAAGSPYGGGYMDDQGWYKFVYDPSIHPAEWAAWDGQNILEYGADESWGPRIDGTTMYRPWYSWYPGDKFGQLEPIRAFPNNVKDFFRTGRTITNSVAFGASGSNYNIRLSYNNQDRTLILYNTRRMQHQIGLNGSYDVSRRVSVSADVTYTYDDRLGQPFETYRNDGLNVTQNFNQWFQRQLDIKGMRNYREPDGRINSWNIGDPNTTDDILAITQPQYWDNPWFIVNEAFQTSRRQRLVANIGLNVEITPHLRWTSYVRRSSSNIADDVRRGTGGLELDSYGTDQTVNSEMNYETNLSYKNTFGNFSVDGFVGGNIRRNHYEYISLSTNGGLTVPNFFNILASKEKPNYANNYEEVLVRSIYGKLSLGYKNFLFLDFTARNDWSSTLPTSNNSYFYPSVAGSFVFSDIMQGSIKDVLTFGKLRAGYASVGSDIGFAQVNTALVGSPPFAGTPLVSYGNTLRNGDIRPALAKSYEIGMELRFIDRIGLDVAYYVNDKVDQILNVDVSSASGFEAVQLNAGKIQSKGIEVTISGTPIRRKDLVWDVTFNIARNTSKLLELARGLQTYLYSTTWNDTRVEHRVGEEWGVLIGRKWIVDEKNGLPVISTSGVPTYETGQRIGNILPDYTGGFVNVLRYKFFDLSFSIDFQKGGLFFSTTRMFNLGTGLAKETVGINDKGKSWRDFPSLGGGIKMVGSDGNGNERIVYVPARRYFYTNLQRATADEFSFDATYIKMRDIRLGVTLPNINSLNTKSINLSVFVTNPWLIYAETKEFGIDPSELEGTWVEGGQLSQTRQIGASLKVVF